MKFLKNSVDDERIQAKDIWIDRIQANVDRWTDKRQNDRNHTKNK